jgi:hypothetical protein
MVVATNDTQLLFLFKDMRALLIPELIIHDLTCAMVWSEAANVSMTWSADQYFP